MSEITTTPPMCSPTVADLAGALAKAQAVMSGASKDKTNPHFKSDYADLASVWDACRLPLTQHGLSVVQPVSAIGPSVTVTTLLLHSSGEWVRSDLTMTAAQNTPQGLGSCITYARRYALSAMVGVAPADDDGEAASKGGASKSEAPALPAGFADWLLDLEATADNGTAALQSAWKSSREDYRKCVSQAQVAALKSRAAKAQPVEAA